MFSMLHAEKKRSGSLGTRLENHTISPLWSGLLQNSSPFTIVPVHVKYMARVYIYNKDTYRIAGHKTIYYGNVQHAHTPP